MAEKEKQSPVPLAPPSYGQSDAEAACSPEQRTRNKRMKCMLYVFLFAVFQTGIILLFTFTVMKITTPKFRMESATLENSMLGLPGNTSLSLTLNAELAVKNSNFGRFKFEETTVYLYHRGVQVAEVPTLKGRANWRSTKKLKVVVNVELTNSAELQHDLSAGVVSLSSRAEMRGDVRLVMMFNKKRSAHMNCTMEIMTTSTTQQISNILCD